MRYADKKLRLAIENNPNVLLKEDAKLRHQLAKLTRILYDGELPPRCEECGSARNLQIHHIRYAYPIKKEDLMRLCMQCHVLEHQKIYPTLIRERG